MNPTFINQTFQNITAPQSLFKEVEIRHDLSAIKKRLLKEVNSLRSQLSLHEFLEDHSINQVLESVILGHSNLINPDDIVTHLRYKISNSDIHILTSSRPLLNLGMSKENLMESLEKCFLDILRELMQVTHKEKFESPKPFNIALKLGYDSSYAYLILAFSQTILSVESISTERGQCVISGLVNSPNYSLFIVLVKFEDYDIVISPNKMSYDFINRAYRIVFDQKYQMPLTMNFCPELQFYVKAGGNSVKYGQGSDFTYQDIMKMSSIITLAYSMPFKPVESPYVKPRMFLKHLVSQSNSRNIPNVQFSPSLSPTFNNSPMPRLSFNSRLSRGDLTAVNEETELRKSPNIARQKRVQWNKGHHNKENMNEENTTEKAYLGSGGSQKHLLSSNQQKATSREGLLFETLGKPTLEEQRYHSAESKLHFQTDMQLQNIKDNQSSQVHLSGLFNPQIRVNHAHLLQNEHGLNQPTQTNQLPLISTQKRSPVKRNINFETDSKYNGFQLNSNLNSASQDFKILVNPTQNTRNSRALAYPGDLHQMANDTQNKYNIVGRDGTSKVFSEAKPQDYASLLTNSTMFSSVGTTRQIIVQPKTIMTPFGTFESVPNTADVKSFDPKELTVDPKLFSEESFSELAIKQLEALEKKLIGNHTFNRVHQYAQLFKSNELQDVILKFKEGEDIMSHRIVLMQAPYFERIFQTAKTLPNEPIKVLMPDFLRVNSFRKVLEFIYNAELAAEDLNSMTIIMAREILLTAYTLQLYHLMDIVLVKVIIPKMDKQMCIEFLKDSFEREDVKSRITWKTLQQYCLNFFALYSKQILKKYKQALEGVEPRLIYKIASTTLMKCRDIHHMYELLALLVEHGFASNILDILEKVPLAREKDKKFDSKCIPNIQEILKSLNPKSCYETNLIDCTSMLNQKSLVEEILDEQEVTSSEFLTANREVQNKNTFNHLEIQMKSNQQCPDPMLESNEWSEIKKIDPIYEMKLHFDSEPKKKTIISQMFDSDTRSWHLVVDIEEDQKLSVFLLERGLPTHSPFAGPFKNEFTSAKYLIQIKDGDHEYETVMFYTFANEHHYCIGHKRLISIPYLAKKDILHIKVWMMELPVYSCAIQYLSTRFNDLLKDTFEDNANSKIINLKGEDKLYLGTKSNNLNQPVSKKGAKSEQKKIQEEFKRRKSINFLEASFFKEMEYSTEPTIRTPRKNEDTSNKIDPLAAHAVNPMLGQPNFRPQQTVRNVSHFEPTKTSQASIENVSRTGFRKSRKFEDLSPYDFYYLVSSDYLTIEHEKFLTYFMYKYTVEKKEEMINLICHGIRFSFIELSKLFNIARDLPAIRNNGVFASKLDFEVATRINSNKPSDRPRKFYSSEMYKDWNFKNDLLRWLIESDHHQGYRLKVEELRMIIKEKENKLKNQEEVIMQMNSKMAKLNLEISRHVEGDGVKKIKLNPPELPPIRQQQQQQQQSSSNIVTTFKNNCNVF